jgi:hypothetical protein
MAPSTIDPGLIAAVEQYAMASADDHELLAHVTLRCPTASPRDIARAALYAATNPEPHHPDLSARLFHFGMNLSRVA